MKDYYYILGINNNASLEEIKTAYRKLSKKFHPDVNDGDRYFENRFKDILEAYEILTDKEKKIKYDELLQRFNNQSAANNKKTIEVKNKQTDINKKYYNHYNNYNWAKPKETKNYKNIFFIIFLISIIFINIVYFGNYGSQGKLKSDDIIKIPIRSYFVSIVVAGLLTGIIKVVKYYSNKK